MKPILVHLHLYYKDMWPMLRDRIAGIPGPYELVVTLPGGNEDLKESVEAFHPGARVLVVENRGFDIAPFFQVLQQCDLERYSYIIKLHTKRELPERTRINGYEMPGDVWRRYLLAIVEPETLQRTLAAFGRDERLGMAADYHLIYNVQEGKVEKELMDRSMELVRKAGLRCKGRLFVAGTMFICRAKLLAPLLELNLRPEDFGASRRDDTFALHYLLERAMGLVVQAQGYRLADPNKLVHPWSYIGDQLGKYILPYIYRHTVNAKGRHHLKIFKIPFPINAFRRLLGLDKG